MYLYTKTICFNHLCVYQGPPGVQGDIGIPGLNGSEGEPGIDGPPVCQKYIDGVVSVI